MFENIKNWILRGIDKMLSKSTIEEALKVKTAISNEMDKAMELWLKVFTNNAPWINKEVGSLQLGASIAEEFARLITLEMKSEVTGSARADFINEYYQKVLLDINTKLALYNAVGGGYFKPYVKGDKFYIDYIPQTDCKPLKFDNAGNITSMVFSSQISKGDKIYTRLETHTLNGTSYSIENRAYVTDTYNSSVLGREISLREVAEWQELSEKTVIENIERPLFAYYKVPLTNNIDTKSCLGVSVYHKAIDSIRKADVQASRLDYEYESAERSIYADVQAIKEENGTAKKQKLIKTLDAGEDGFYKEFSPQLRDEGYIRGQNKNKQEIEFQVQLAYGTISDPSMIEKTATEINASKQRSYSAVSKMQAALQSALEHLVYILDVYADLYELAPAGEINTSFDWDDSIVVDSEKKQSQSLVERNAGLIDDIEYFIQTRDYSEEEATDYVNKMRKRKPKEEMLEEEQEE